MTTKKTTPSLGEQMKKIKDIITWFEDQEEVDIEKGLEKAKEGAALIKAARQELREIENEFEVVKKDLEKV